MKVTKKIFTFTFNKTEYLHTKSVYKKIYKFSMIYLKLL